MSEVDAKVNMSLDDIIKMEKKDKKKKAVGLGGGGKGGAKRTRGGKGRGVAKQGLAGKTAKPNPAGPMKFRRLQQEQQNPRRPGFVTKRYKRNKKNNNNGAAVVAALAKSRSNIALNRLNNNNPMINPNVLQGAFVNARRGNPGKFGLARSRSRANLLQPNIKRFFNNKAAVKRTNSLPNLRDPGSVHSRLGYQSPAQMAYRNRVKRAKQLLIQRQNQRMLPPMEYRLSHNGKAMSNLQHHSLVERGQQIISPQRNFASIGLRSDQILRAQRRAQYAQKLMRLNALRMTPDPNVNFMCTLSDDYTAGLRQHSMSMGHNQNRGRVPNNPHPLARARSPYRQNIQHVPTYNRGPAMNRQPRTRSRSRSRSRSRNASMPQHTSPVDDRTFSEMMYSLTGNLGVTERTLNDRFTF